MFRKVLPKTFLRIQVGRSFSVRLMAFIKNRTSLLFIPLAAALSISAVAQNQAKEKTEPAPAPQSQSAAQPGAQKVPDHAASYYHASMARLYEEMITMYGRSEYANKAIEEYKLAIAADPSSEYLNAALAELYNRTGRIRDAVLEAQQIIKRDPNNIEAHKLLGKIYLRSLGDAQPGTGSDSVLKLAIEQYEEIVKLEPESVDNHLLLGRLYKVNNDLQKAEGEFKIAVKLEPQSEEAVTTLALLYTE